MNMTTILNGPTMLRNVRLQGLSNAFPSFKLISYDSKTSFAKIELWHGKIIEGYNLKFVERFRRFIDTIIDDRGIHHWIY